jgi:hypothetical protein
VLKDWVCRLCCISLILFQIFKLNFGLALLSVSSKIRDWSYIQHFLCCNYAATVWSESNPRVLNSFPVGPSYDGFT